MKTLEQQRQHAIRMRNDAIEKRGSRSLFARLWENEVKQLTTRILRRDLRKRKAA